MNTKSVAGAGPTRVDMHPARPPPGHRLETATGYDVDPQEALD
ncbi:hypothetical protein [Streptomyces sp. S5]|nr:hypothetical protein [Streptomyces sp. S5]